MRRGKVFYKGLFAGIITETNDGEYIFRYDEQYAEDHPEKFITFQKILVNTISMKYA